MSASKCAKCDLTVYPVEGLRCLDKIWHKGCFKCHECNMTLNMKNYKGFEKRPYCNAHCPQAKATTVADTPEIRRLAENTRIQSQAKYHEDFEKSKGKGFTAIADDPETLRLKNTSKIISNVAYHGELERKKQMEEKRGQRDDEILNISINKHPNRSHNNNNSNGNNQGAEFVTQHQVNNHNQYHPNQQQLQQQQQIIMQQKQLQQKQKQQQQQQQQQHHHHHQNQQQILKQQVHYAQDLNDQPVITRQVSQVDGHLNQQQATAKHSQQFNTGSPHHHHHHNQQQQQLQHQQQQQQILSRQQQQQLLLQQQQHRQSIDMSLPMNRHQVKHHQSTGNNNNNNIINNNNNLPQAIIKNHMMPAQSHHHQQQQLPVKYVVANDPSARNLITGPPPHILNQTQLSGIPNGQRIATNAALIANPQVQHHMMQPAFNHQQITGLNVAMPKQQHYMYPQQQQQPRHPIHPSQMQQLNHHNVHQQHHHHQIGGSQLPPAQQQQHQVTRRVFRAMFDYVANDVDEVSFFENDILIDCVNVDGNWLIGKVARSGQTGMLPANYVAELTSQ